MLKWMELREKQAVLAALAGYGEWEDDRPLVRMTAEEWEALPEEVCRRFEVVEGWLVLTPRPTSLHQWVSYRLCVELDRQCPPGLWPVQEVDVRLVDVPLTLRAPDVIVTSSAPRAGSYRAEEVVLAVEIPSPSTVRRDRERKPAQYARAGIPYFWLVELDGDTVSLHAHELRSESYRLQSSFRAETATLTQPFAVEIDLARLTRR